MKTTIKEIALLQLLQEKVKRQDEIILKQKKLLEEEEKIENEIIFLKNELWV